MNPDPFAALNANFSQDRLNQFMQMQNAMQKQQSQPTPQTTPTKTGRGKLGSNPFSALISEGGAIGGAALGASIGSVVPVVGTAIGGILGAGVGALGGRLAENKLRDDEFRPGSALGEAVLSASLAGVGPAFKAVKGARGALKASGGLDDAIMAAKSSFSTQPGARTAQIGEKLVAKSRGITPGVGKTASRNGLSIKEAGNLNKFLDDVGVKPGTPLKQLEQVESLKSMLFKQQDSILQTSNKRLSAGTINKIRQEVTDLVVKTPGLSLTPQFTDDLAKLGKTRNVKSLNAFRQSLDDLINFNRASATPDPSVERLYRTLRTSVDNQVAKLAPELKQTNTTLSKLYKAEGFLQDSAKRAASTSEAGAMGFKIPVLGNRIPGEVTQGVRSKLGSTLQGRGVQGSIKAASAVGPQLAGRVPGAMMGVAQAPQNSSMINPNTPSMTTANTMPSATSNIMGQQYQTGQQMSSGSPYSRENLMSDLQRDPQNADKYLAYYQQLQEVFSPQTEGLELNNTAIARISDFESGIQALDDMGNRIAQSGVNQPFIGDLRRQNPFDTEAQDLNSTIRSVRQLVGRALEGGVLRREDEIKYEQMLPKIGDTDATARAKIENVRRLLTTNLQAFMQNQQKFSGGPQSLEDAMMQYAQ